MAIEAKSYKKKVIIFLDILGVKDFTLSNSEDKLIDVYNKIRNLAESNLQDMLHNAFSTPHGNPRIPEAYLHLNNAEDLDICVSIVSDTIIVSFSKKYIFLLPTFLRFLRPLMIFILKYGLLARGAVACDKIYNVKDTSINIEPIIHSKKIIACKSGVKFL